MEKVTVENKIFHDKCFKCTHCGKRLELGTYTAGHHGNFYCKPHYHTLFMSKGNYSESENKNQPQKQKPAPPAAVPPPPPPAPSMESVLAKESGAAAPASEGGMSAALASIATGGPKLKHVSREERKKKPTTSLVPGDNKPLKEEKAPAGKEAVAKGDPVLKLEDKKWTVRFQENRQENPVVIDITAFQQSVSIANCNKAVIQIKGKCTNIAIMNSTNCGVIFDDVVASVEVIRSKKIQLQVNGSVPQIALDNSAGVDIFIQSAAGKNTEVVTSQTEGVNVTFPAATPDGDPIEYPVPMQFISVLKNGKLVTTPSSHV